MKKIQGRTKAKTCLKGFRATTHKLHKLRIVSERCSELGNKRLTVSKTVAAVSVVDFDKELMMTAIV